MARDSNPLDRDVSLSRQFDKENGKRDRQTLAVIDDLVQEAVSFAVVFHPAAAEAQVGVEIADQPLESFSRGADSVQTVFELRGKAVKKSEVGLSFQLRIVGLGEEQGCVNQVEVVIGLAEEHGKRYFNQPLVHQGGQVLDAKGLFFKFPGPRLQLPDDRGAVTREALDDLGGWGSARIKF